MKAKLVMITTAVFFMLLPFYGTAQQHNRNQRNHRTHTAVHKGQQKNKHTPKKDKKSVQEIIKYKGKITEWTYNDDMIYDGFYLQNQDGTFLVKVSTHLANEIRNMGNDITVNGLKASPARGDKEIKTIRMVSIESNGKTLYNGRHGLRAINRQHPANEQFVNETAKVSELNKDKRGKVTGYVLDNNTILRIPRHSAEQLSQLVNPDARIGYTGVERLLKDGEVKANNSKIVRAQTITVNGTQYLIK